MIFPSGYRHHPLLSHQTRYPIMPTDNPFMAQSSLYAQSTIGLTTVDKDGLDLLDEHPVGQFPSAWGPFLPGIIPTVAYFQHFTHPLH